MTSFVPKPFSQDFCILIDSKYEYCCYQTTCRHLKPRSNDRNIVGRNMLHGFGHSVATCCAVLGVVGSNLTIFKHKLMSQHEATRWPNARNMLLPTLLRYVALACCHRFPGASDFSRRASPYFFARCFSRCTPTNRTPERG